MISDSQILARVHARGLAGFRREDGADLALAPDDLESRLRQLAADGRVLTLPVTPPAWIAPAVWLEFARTLAAAESTGRDLSEHLPAAARPHAAAYERLYRAMAPRPNRRQRSGRGEAGEGRDRLRREILTTYRQAGLEAPSPAAVARRLGHRPEIVAGLIDALVAAGELLRLAGGLVIARSSVDDLAARLTGSNLEDFRVRDFTAWSGLSRKWAVPLLEHFDGRGVTRRQGPTRRLAGKAPGAGGKSRSAPRP